MSAISSLNYQRDSDPYPVPLNQDGMLSSYKNHRKRARKYKIQFKKSYS